MADLSDAIAALGHMAEAAVYPNGTGSPSVTGRAVKVTAEWPLARDIDAAMKADTTIVSVIPTGGSAAPMQIVDDKPYTVTPAVHTLTSVVDQGALSVTVSGSPSAGEFLSITLDTRVTYSRNGADVASILAAIAADAAARYPGVAVSGSTITFPGANFIEARSGAPAVSGRVTHRNRQLLDVSAWASTPQARDTLAAALTVALTAVNRITMPDGSKATIFAVSDRQANERETALVYRRSMVFAVEYGTVETFTVYEITSFGAALDEGPSLLGHIDDDTTSSEGQDP